MKKQNRENMDLIQASRSRSHSNSNSHSSNIELSARLLKRGNFVLRQELNSYTPECSAKCGIIFNSFLMVIFILAGVPIIICSNSIKEYKIDYSDW